MTAQDKLNKAARAHGWANWSEVLMHNAPAHVINLIVEEAMRGEPVSKTEPALTWRKGARVRITGNSGGHCFEIGNEVRVDSRYSQDTRIWACYNLDRSDFWYVHESDAVVVG